MTTTVPSTAQSIAIDGPFYGPDLPLPYGPETWEQLPFVQHLGPLGRISLGCVVGILPSQQANVLLAEYWTGGEWPSGVSRSHLVKAFIHAGFVTDTPGIVAPTEPMTLYRGATRKTARGFSWTTNPRKAFWFADFCKQVVPTEEARVLTATIPPKHVFGIFHGRKEAEVVVNPNGLQKLVRFEEGILVDDSEAIHRWLEKVEAGKSTR